MILKNVGIMIVQSNTVGSTPTSASNRVDLTILGGNGAVLTTYATILKTKKNGDVILKNVSILIVQDNSTV